MVRTVRRSSRAFSWAALSALCLALWSCTDASHVLNPFTSSESPDISDDLAAISGLVVNVSGAPLAGARLEVRSSGSELTSLGFADLGGRFFLANLELERDVVRFSSTPQLFNANFRRLRLNAGVELHFPRVMLLPVVRGPVFFASNGGAANIGALGSRAEFPESSFIRADSTLYADRVAPYLAVTTLLDPHFAAAFPGEFVGVRTGGQDVPLEALGALWVFVDSQAGPMQLAADVAVTYRLGIGEPAGITLPPTTLVWVLDRWAGTWNEAGEAPLTDGFYEVTLPSLGPIAWANPAAEICEVVGTVTDNLGEPLPNVNVTYSDLGGRFRTSVLTEEDGGFVLPVTPSQAGLLTPYLGSIAGARDTISTLGACPLVLEEPLTITLPSYHIDLNWNAPDADLDAYYRIFIEDDDRLKLQWVLNFIERGRLDLAPYTRHDGDARGTSGPETITGRRWYDGKTEYWVHDYSRRRTDALRASGAVVDLVINEEPWQFPVADAVYDEATSDTSGWWHVFDIVIDGPRVTVEPRQRFAPAPQLRP